VEKEASSVKKQRLPPIPDAERVGEVSRATLDFLRRNLGGNLPLSLPQVEETVRFLPVAKHCSAVRERKGLTISDAAKQLKVPQYRLLAAIGNRGNLTGAVHSGSAGGLGFVRAKDLILAAR
jgi:hypothetical protein